MLLRSRQSVTPSMYVCVLCFPSFECMSAQMLLPLQCPQTPLAVYPISNVSYGPNTRNFTALMRHHQVLTSADAVKVTMEMTFDVKVNLLIVHFTMWSALHLHCGVHVCLLSSTTMPPVCTVVCMCAFSPALPCHQYALWCACVPSLQHYHATSMYCACCSWHVPLLFDVIYFKCCV